MKLYYVGTLMSASKPVPHKLEIKYYQYFNHNSMNETGEYLIQSEYNYIKKYMSLFLNTATGIDDKQLISYLKKIRGFDMCYQYLKNEEIVFEIIEDEFGMFYGKELITGLLFPLSTKANDTKFFYRRNTSGDHILDKFDIYSDKNMERFACVLLFKEAASANYINNYLKENNNKTFINAITRHYNDNVFNKEIIEKEKEPDLRQDEITKIMGTIEYFLNVLKILNNDIYIEQKNKYNDLFKDPDEKYLNASKFKYRQPSKKDLLKFLSNLKLSLIICKNNCNNISEYLNVIINMYLNKNNDADDIKLQINDIDNMMELFLTDKEKYNAVEQRNILNKFARLYILIIKLNNIPIINLDKSYFKDDLDGIYSEMISLYNEGIINIYPSITNNNITLKNTYDEIMNIQFKKINKNGIKKLVK